MAGIIEKLSNWYASLAEQEQRILLFGAPLIVFLVLYLLLIQPLGSAYFARSAELRDRQEDLLWVREQRQMLERLNTSCDLRSVVFAQQNLQSDIEAAARRFGITPVIRTQADSYELRIESAEGNRILNLIRVLGCGGSRVTSLELQKLGADTTELSVTIRVERGG